MLKSFTTSIILTCLINLCTLSSYAEELTSPELNNLKSKPAFSQSISNNFVTRKYIIGPNDIISISIQNIPELDQKNIHVQPDGKIIISSIGSIKVAGLTLDELKDLLCKKYSYYLENPQLSINLEQSRPFIVYVTGAVMNPGSYELNSNTNSSQYVSNNKPEAYIERKTPLLSNILVAAGGISYDSDLEHVQITNNIENTKYVVNLLSLLDKGDTDQDIYLMAGDSVYIPRLLTPLAVSEEKYKKFASATFSPKTVPVKVYGYVNNPGLINLDPAQSLSLNSAISSAGGYLHDSAYAPQKIYISRVDNNGKLVTRVVNPTSSDTTLMPKDIVYVPEKTVPMAGKAFDYLTRVINPISNIAGASNSWILLFNPSRYHYP